MLPVSIITGFLGSGKTTLLNNLLRQPSFEHSLVIINEFGEIGIDHLIVSAPDENMRLLSNGCLCCEVRGELFETLVDALGKREAGEIPTFNRILIETTGLADPVPILRTIVADEDLKKLCRMERVIGVIDAVHAPLQIAAQDEARKQIAVSDVLLLTKTDLISAARKAEAEAAIRAINARADLITVERGKVDPELLFRGPEAAEHDLTRWLSEGVHAHGSHAGDIGTLTLDYGRPVSEAGLATWLSMLTEFKGTQLLRVKGIVNVGGDPYVIHVVQTVVHEPIPLDAWPTEDERSRIVFIGRDLERATLENSFAAFSLAESLDDTQMIDPFAYARFREAAQRLI